MRVEQLLLALLADVGHEQVPLVAVALVGGEGPRRRPRPAVVLPAVEAAGHRDHVPVARAPPASWRRRPSARRRRSRRRPAPTCPAAVPPPGTRAGRGAGARRRRWRPARTRRAPARRGTAAWPRRASASPVSTSLMRRLGLAEQLSRVGIAPTSGVVVRPTPSGRGPHTRKTLPGRSTFPPGRRAGPPGTSGPPRHAGHGRFRARHGHGRGRGAPPAADGPELRRPSPRRRPGRRPCWTTPSAPHRRQHPGHGLAGARRSASRPPPTGPTPPPRSGARRSRRWPGLSRAPGGGAVAGVAGRAYVRRYGETGQGRPRPRAAAGPAPARRREPAPGAGRRRGPCPYWFGDAAFATMGLLLEATAAGLGACFLGNFRGEGPLLAALGVPPGWRLFGAVLLGHPEGPDPPLPLARPPRARPVGPDPPGPVGGGGLTEGSRSPGRRRAGE